MKKYIYTIISFACSCLLFSSCDKYLEIEPKGTTLLKTVEDYDQWLNAEDLIYGPGGANTLINFLADNFDLVSISNPPIKVEEMIYVWAQQFSPVINDPPVFWGEHYARINHFNTALLGIEKATGGTASKIRSLRSEALLGRAFEYFYLVNLYAKPYNASTANTDLAVPFVVSNDVTQIVPGRSTVAEIYSYMIEDIQKALTDLPDDNSQNRFRGSKAAAYSLLARIYFYASNYPEALRNANLAIDFSQTSMIDFNGAVPATNLISTHSDVIYGRMAIGNAVPTLEFLQSFANNDLRVRKLYYSADGFSFTTRSATFFMPAYVTPQLTFINTGTSLQEMKLIIAESAIRTGNADLALTHLDEIRQNRFNSATYVPFTSTDPALILKEVLTERSHELPFNGLRWFDMRRLNVANEMPTVHRRNAVGDIIATLEPTSERYTLQIPLQAINYNPNMPQNP